MQFRRSASDVDLSGLPAFAVYCLCTHASARECAARLPLRRRIPTECAGILSILPIALDAEDIVSAMLVIISNGNSLLFSLVTHSEEVYRILRVKQTRPRRSGVKLAGGRQAQEGS